MTGSTCTSISKLPVQELELVDEGCIGSSSMATDSEVVDAVNVMSGTSETFSGSKSIGIVNKQRICLLCKKECLTHLSVQTRCDEVPSQVSSANLLVFLTDSESYLWYL